MSVILFKALTILIVIAVTNAIAHYHGYKEGFIDGRRKTKIGGE